MTAKASAKTINAKRGRRFAIELPSNAATGYRWEVTPDESCVRVVERQHKVEGKAIGAGGVEKFVFEAVRKGTTTIAAVYKRPWEAQGIETRSFRVNVEDA